MSLTEMLVVILGRISDPKKSVQADKITKASFDECNLRSSEHIHLSDEITCTLEHCKEVDKSKFRLNVKNHFVAIGLHIVKKTSYDNPIVKALKYIAPAYILEPESSDEIIGVAKQLPFSIPPTALDEWNCIRAYVEVEKLQTWKGRIDDFWNIIFDLKGVDNLPRFPIATKIIKCFLSLTHGSAEVERGFSESGLILTDDKTKMIERTLNARLNVKCGLKLFYENSLVSVPIDKNFVKSARFAYQNYGLYMEKCKQEEDKKEREKELEQEKLLENRKIFEKIRLAKNEVERLEVALNTKKKEKTNNACKLMSEANERLKDAIKTKNMQEITIAQAMIQGAGSLLESEDKNKQEIEELSAKVSQRKTDIIQNYLKRKPEKRK